MSLHGPQCQLAIVDADNDRKWHSQQPLQPGHRPSPGLTNPVPMLVFDPEAGSRNGGLPSLPVLQVQVYSMEVVAMPLRVQWPQEWKLH